MTDTPNPATEPSAGKGLPAIVWLFVAFLPALISVPIIAGKAMSQWGALLLVLAIVCCVSSGLGILKGIKDGVLRVFLGVLLGGVFFVLNVVIAVFIGCSTMGPI